MAPSPIMIPAAINQERSEADADLFFSGLGFLGTSTECEEEITNFLCLKLFGLCIDGEFVSIDNETCMLLRDRLCPNEWELAGDFLGEENLPNCETLPKRQLDCDDGKFAEDGWIAKVYIPIVRTVCVCGGGGGGGAFYHSRSTYISEPHLSFRPSFFHTPNLHPPPLGKISVYSTYWLQTNCTISQKRLQMNHALNHLM